MDQLAHIKDLTDAQLRQKSYADLNFMLAACHRQLEPAEEHRDRLMALRDQHGKLTTPQTRELNSAAANALHATEQAERVVAAQYVAEDRAITEAGFPVPAYEPNGLGGRRPVDVGVRSSSPEAYSVGRALTRSQTFSGYVQSRQLVRSEDRLDLGKYLRGIVTGEWDHADAERRAMSEGVLGSGGYMVPTALLAEVIDLARAKARVLEAGARLVPMETQVVKVARWTGDPTAAWHSESAVITPSDATLGSVELTAKTLTSITKASRELLQDASNVESELRNAFTAAFALEVDRVALYGTGTDPEPRGIKNTTGVTTAALGANGAAPTWDHLVDAAGVLEDANESPSGFLYSPRTGRKLAKQKTTDGQYVAPPTILDGIGRYPTNQVPNDLTEGTAAGVTSDIFTGNFAQLLIGLRTSMEIRVLSERYADTGELGIAAWWRGDVAVARGAAFHVSTGAL